MTIRIQHQAQKIVLELNNVVFISSFKKTTPMKNKRGEGPQKQEMRTMRIVQQKLKTVPMRIIFKHSKTLNL